MNSNRLNRHVSKKLKSRQTNQSETVLDFLKHKSAFSHIKDTETRKENPQLTVLIEVSVAIACQGG
jgi:hypothetical protein